MANESESTGADEGRRTDHARSANPRSRGLRGILGVPLAVVGTVAVTLGVVQPAEATPQTVKRPSKSKGLQAEGARTVRVAATATPPAEYLVVEGDTVSGIAERFGLATAEVLALNGLSWSSLIFPGQRLALPGGAAAPAGLPPAETEIRKHVVVEGDTVIGIAAAYGVDAASILSANGLGTSSMIFPGESIVLPPSASAAPAATESAEPALDSAAPESHTVAEGDTLSGIAAAHDLTVADLDRVNGLGGSTVIHPGQVLVVGRPEPVVPEASVNVPLDDEMRGHARIIIEMGRALGVPGQGIVVALAAAAQESGLRNLRHGDRVLRRRRQPESRSHEGASRHPRLGGDDRHAGGAGGAALRLPRPLREVGDRGARVALGARLNGLAGRGIRRSRSRCNLTTDRSRVLVRQAHLRTLVR